MGTRADFYAGKNETAEWLGSIAWDGYRDGIPAQILECRSEEAFRHAVSEFIAERDDGTKPEQGWPWPWNDSGTTDCSYWFFEGKCWEAGGRPEVYVPCDQREPNWDTIAFAAFERVKFPDMKDRKNVRWDSGSGLIVVSALGKKGDV